MVSTLEIINAPETLEEEIFIPCKSFIKIVDETYFEEEDSNHALQPPPNFAMVGEGVYRSGYPTTNNFSFLKKLNLKSILYLCPEEYPVQMKKFIESNGIIVFQYGLEGNKPVMRIPSNVIRDALAHVLDVRNHPMLIHCNRGKHRTGCLVGCLRKEQHWSLGSIIEEYNMYAGLKIRALDQLFIRNFNLKVPYDPNYLPSWLDSEYLEDLNFLNEQEKSQM